MPTLSTRDRRALVAGVLTISALVLASQGVPRWRATRDAIAAKRSDVKTRIALQQLLLKHEHAIRDSGMARSRRYLDLARAILPGRSPGAAAAELVAIVSGAASGAALRVGAVQVQPDSTRFGVFRRISVRADVTGDIRGISSLLLTLERGPLLLRVRDLAITQLDPTADDSRAETLRGELLIQALMLGQQP